MSRPDYIVCIAHTHAELQGTSWCGRCVKAEFHFASIDHATYNVRGKGRLLACPECATAVIKLLNLETI